MDIGRKREKKWNKIKKILLYSKYLYTNYFIIFYKYYKILYNN